MTMWMVEYTYDDQTEQRDRIRPEHRAYLASLVEGGDMLAYGRYDDSLEPGALLIYIGDDADAVEALIQADPFVRAGFVPRHRVRRWAGTWSTRSV